MKPSGLFIFCASVAALAALSPRVQAQEGPRRKAPAIFSGEYLQSLSKDWNTPRPITYPELQAQFTSLADTTFAKLIREAPDKQRRDLAAQLEAQPALRHPSAQGFRREFVRFLRGERSKIPTGFSRSQTFWSWLPTTPDSALGRETVIRTGEGIMRAGLRTSHHSVPLELTLIDDASINHLFQELYRKGPKEETTRLAQIMTNDQTQNLGSRRPPKQSPTVYGAGLFGLREALVIPDGKGGTRRMGAVEAQTTLNQFADTIFQESLDQLLPLNQKKEMAEILKRSAPAANVPESAGLRAAMIEYFLGNRKTLPAGFARSGIFWAQLEYATQSESPRIVHDVSSISLDAVSRMYSRMNHNTPQSFPFNREALRAVDERELFQAMFPNAPQYERQSFLAKTLAGKTANSQTNYAEGSTGLRAAARREVGRARKILNSDAVRNASPSFVRAPGLWALPATLLMTYLPHVLSAYLGPGSESELAVSDSAAKSVAAPGASHPARTPATKTGIAR